MVSKPGLSSFIMNFLFKFKAPPIPMKNFTNEDAAREWLRQYSSDGPRLTSSET